MECESVVMRVCLSTLGLLLTVAGCSKSMQPVRGKVTLPDGTPVNGALVVFEGEGGDKAVTARGDVQTDGGFEMSTYKPGDGVPIGKYKVLVAPPPMVNADAPARPPFDTKYSNFATSGLRFDVKAGNNDFPIQVTK